MNIGFVGLGQMGSRMAQNVLKAGFNLTVFDIRKETAQQLLENRAKWMDTPRSIAESCEVILSSLPGPPEVEDAGRGEENPGTVILTLEERAGVQVRVKE